MGFPNARYSLRGHQYETDFGKMKQKNLGTGKERQIRPPHKWKAPSAPITKPGPTTCITVPPGSPGTTIQVPNPKDKKTFIAVNVPVGGAVLGEHIAEEGWDATMADLGDVATTAGEGIADGAEAAVEWVGDAADTAGDFIMDLF